MYRRIYSPEQIVGRLGKQKFRRVCQRLRIPLTQFP